MFGQGSSGFGAGAGTTNSTAPKATFSFGGPAASSTAAPAAASSPFSFGNTSTSTAAPATTGGGLFGAQPQQQQQQQQAANPFAPKPAAAANPFGSFGASTQAQPAAGASTSIFGAQNNTTGGSMFGQQQNTQNQAGQTGQTGGLFANTSTAQPASTFGQPAQPSTGLFGSTSAQPSTGIFGSASIAQPAQLSGGGLFSSTSQPAQPAQAPGTGTFSFGQPAAKPAGSLFGSTTTSTQPAGGAGGFGTFGSLDQSTQAQAQQQQQPGGGAFGFGFGSTNQQQQQQKQQQQMMQSQLQQPPSQLQLSILGQSTFKKEVPIQQRLEAIQAGWDSGNPECRFKAFFYNVVEPQDVPRYTQPQNVSAELWAKAERENPDRSCLVPVLATGWEDVEKRLNAQKQMANAESHQIQELSKKLASIERQKTLQATLKLVALQSRLSQLQHRLVHLAVNTGLVAQAGPSSSSSSSSSYAAGTRAREQQLRSTLEAVKADMDGTSSSASAAASRGKAGLLQNGSSGANGGSRPGTPGGNNRRNAAGQRMMGQVNELWGAVEELRRHRGYQSGVARGREGQGWVQDERIMGEIAKVLTQQQLALQKLSSVLEDSKFDAKVISDNLTNLGL